MIRASSKSGMKIGKAEDGNQELQEFRRRRRYRKIFTGARMDDRKFLTGIQDLPRFAMGDLRRSKCLLETSRHTEGVIRLSPGWIRRLPGDCRRNPGY
jgi:hypothetical protein